MNRLSVLRLVCMLAVFTLAPLARGADCSVPIQLPDRPQIDQFADYNTFLVEAMKYKTKKREQAEHKQKCPLAYVEKQRPSRDPTKIEGPETLSDALQRTRKIPRIDYSRHQKWYDRTTSRSFPLPDLGSDELSSRAIDTSLEKMRYNPDPDPRSRQDREQALAGEKERELAREKMRERDPDRPRQGAEELPDIFSRDLNKEWFNGGEGQRLFGSLTEQLLPFFENQTESVAGDGPFESSIASFALVQRDEKSELKMFLGHDGNAIKGFSRVSVETCLSSCLMR